MTSPDIHLLDKQAKFAKVSSSILAHSGPLETPEFCSEKDYKQFVEKLGFEIVGVFENDYSKLPENPEDRIERTYVCARPDGFVLTWDTQKGFRNTAKLIFQMQTILYENGAFDLFNEEDNNFLVELGDRGGTRRFSPYSGGGFDRIHCANIKVEPGKLGVILERVMERFKRRLLSPFVIPDETTNCVFPPRTLIDMTCIADGEHPYFIKMNPPCFPLDNEVADGEHYRHLQRKLAVLNGERQIAIWKEKGEEWFGELVNYLPLPEDRTAGSTKNYIARARYGRPKLAYPHSS